MAARSTWRVLWTLMDTYYHPEIKFQSTAYGERKFSRGKKTLLSVRDVFEKKKRRGWISTLDRTVRIASVSLCNQDEMARLLYCAEVEMVKSLCAFNVKMDTIQEDHIMYVKPLWQVRKMWRNQSTELMNGPRPRPLSAETKALVETLDLLQFHLFDYSC